MGRTNEPTCMSHRNTILKPRTRVHSSIFLSSILFFAAHCSQKGKSGNEDWASYGGNKKGNRYSTLTQIDSSNVKNLKIAWAYDTGENKDSTRGIDMQCQPIIVDGVLYGISPRLKLFAVAADSGKELWKFNPYEKDDEVLHPNRGVTYWADGDDKRIFFAAGPKLYAINAATGKPVASFGTNGFVDLHEGLADKIGRDMQNLAVTVTTPGVVYKDILIIGSRVSEFGDAAPGYIRGFNARTGKLQWVFHTIPQPGELGYDTWPKDAWKTVGGVNAWSGIVLDEKRGAVYMGTGSASFDFYGGNRPGANLFANSILALNAETGKYIWHFQTVHHDIWDKDLPCPPNLVTVTQGGKKIDAVAQSTKDGLVYVLDRDSGKPLFPVEERPVPTTGAMPGEVPYPTQPFPTKPAPFTRQVFTEAEITNLTPEAHAFVKARLETSSNKGNKFDPPTDKGILIFGVGGGAEWGGNATDPDGILYQNGNEMLWDLKLMTLSTRNKMIALRGKNLYTLNCAACHGADRRGSGKDYPNLTNVGARLKEEEIHAVLKSGRGRMPPFKHLNDFERNAIVLFLLNKEGKEAKGEDDQHSVKEVAAKKDADFPYVPPYINNGWLKLMDPNGYPAVKPPWGTLNAIDLNTGEYVWRVPLGEYPELTKKGIPLTGTENYGGPIVTAGGLVFIAATQDEKIRAFSKKTGKVLWEYKLPAGAFATPATYMVNGKQYIVVAAGGSRNGHKPGGSYIAFALP